MNIQLQMWVRDIRQKYISNPGVVLEIGSLDLNGSIRRFFCGATKYTGIDMRPGENVDIVINAHDLLSIIQPQSIDTVLAVDVLEHDDAFWRTLEVVNTIIKKDGHFLVAVPSLWGVHRHPKDYWRFQEDGLKEVLMKGYSIKESDALMEPSGNTILCAYGRKL